MRGLAGLLTENRALSLLILSGDLVGVAEDKPPLASLATVRVGNTQRASFRRSIHLPGHPFDLDRHSELVGGERGDVLDRDGRPVQQLGGGEEVGLDVLPSTRVAANCAEDRDVVGV
jgi:hypothetical protein